MLRNHIYKVFIDWKGNKGTGTNTYKSYHRSYTISIEGKPIINASSDPAFLGDETKHNPEDLLMGAIAGCHMLWYLHLCAINGVIVIDYIDEAVGEMEENADGSGQFKEITLRPIITVQKKSMIEKAFVLHQEANNMCFIARSVNFPIHHKPSVRIN